MARHHPFDAELLIPGLPEPTKIQSIEQLSDFFQHEVDAWSDLVTRASASEFPLPKRALNDVLRYWTTQLSHVSNALSDGATPERTTRLVNAVREVNASLFKRHMVSVASPAGARIAAAGKSNPEAAGNLLVFMLEGSQLSEIRDAQRFMPEVVVAMCPPAMKKAESRATAAALEVERIKSAADNALGDLLAANEDRARDFDTLRRTWNDDYNKFSGEVQQAFNDAQTARDDEFKRLVAAYDARQKLLAPRQYWRKKFDGHSRATIGWAVAFVLIAVAGGFGVHCVVSSYSDALTNAKQGTFGWVEPVMMIGGSLFLLLWALRFLSRQVNEHLLRKQDSSERMVMIETFLALVRTKYSPAAVSEPAQLAVIINALFRPGPGMAGDDSPPANLVEAISKLAKQ